MNEYLYIENFGPIVEVELKDIKPFTILIGESGSGKSTIMKVLSLFRWIYKRINLRSYLKLSNIKNTRISFNIKNLMKTSGIFEFLKSDTVIVYRRDGYEVRMENMSVSAKKDINVDDLCLDKICFISDKRSMIPDILDYKIDKRMGNYYLQDTIDNFLLATANVKSFSMDYLGVELKVEKSKTGVVSYKIKDKTNEAYSIDLKYASSGMQTVTPLGIITEYFATKFDSKESMNSSLFSYMQDAENLKAFSTARDIGDIQKRNVHIMIEEPELILYPESQKSLIDFLVYRCFNSPHDYKMSLMLATHSPYILNYMNLLVDRYEKGKDTKYKVSFDDVAAFEIADGLLYDLKIEGERKLVDSRSLSDPISSIYSEFNEK